MTLYLRAYDDFSYEIMYIEGKIKKSKIHVLINPGRHIYLPGQNKDENTLNTTTLTHIISMETSVVDPELISRTIRIAEKTNKPIITNKETAKILREGGLSIKQLRIIGFEEEVVEGIHIDPVYLEELSDDIVEIKSPKGLPIFQNEFFDLFRPKKWKIFAAGQNREPSREEIIDPSKPLAYVVEFGRSTSILLPLDRRGLENVNRIIPQLQPNILILPNKDVAVTRDLERGLNSAIILNDQFENDELLLIPKSHNPGIFHDTYYGGLEEWVEIT